MTNFEYIAATHISIMK